MKALIKSVFVYLFFLLLPLMVFAQEKTQYYYSTHESEILPDAKTAFGKGEYDRAVLLCRWHFVMVGDNAADALREKAEQCAQLSTDLASLYYEGKTEEALDVANKLLSINSDDPNAKRIAGELTPSDNVFAPESVGPEPPVMDTIITSNPLPHEDVIEEPSQESENTINRNPVIAHASSEQTRPTPKQKNDVSRNMLIIKGGLFLIDFKQVSPDVSIGLYDIVGSNIGVETGTFFCPGLSSESASFWGIDLDLVYRVGGAFYPKAGFGLFSCSSTDGYESKTNGLCAEMSLTYVLFHHLCIEFGAKVFPELMLSGLERVSTAGTAYMFPSDRSVISGGVAPMIRIGWAF